jgi:hypothetical protein
MRSVYNWLRLHRKEDSHGWSRSGRAFTRNIDEFWLNEDAFPGTVSRCLFYLSVEDTQKHWGEDKKKQIKELLGYLPEQSIGVSSGCNQDEDHSTLGQFVLHLAKVYSGLIWKVPSRHRSNRWEKRTYKR